MPAFGLYSHIRSNRRRSVLLLAGLFGLVYVLTFASALVMQTWSVPGLPLDDYVRRAFNDLLRLVPWVTLGTLLWISLAYFWHQSIVSAATGAARIGREDDPRLYNLLENLCISRGLPMPKLAIVETDALNAFASGLDETQYSITVTRGLLTALNDAELEAVLAHELTHIRNEDVRMMVIAVVIAGIVFLVGELVFRWSVSWPRLSSGNDSSTSDSDNRKSSGGAFAAILLAAALIALAWLLSQVIRFALSRSREFLADAGAVELTKNPDAMIAALMKIEGRGELPGAPSGIMEMCIDNPRSGFADLFATHPSIESRIEALVQNAGGQLPMDARKGPWG